MLLISFAFVYSDFDPYKDNSGNLVLVLLNNSIEY